MFLCSRRFVVLLAVFLGSCSIRPTDSVRSPSGRFKVVYDPGNQEADAYYEISDRTKRVKGGHWDLDGHFVRGSYSICSGAESPFDESRVIWSPSEMTILVLFGFDKEKHCKRFLLVRQNDDAADGPDAPYSRFWLIGMKGLESQFFNGSTARILSATDKSVSFMDDTERRTIEIGLDTLEVESQRQEKQLDEQVGRGDGDKPPN